MDYEKFGVVIPAFNEEVHIAEVIAKVENYIPKDHIVVIDDGSTDGTADEAERMGVIVMKHAENRGKGASLITGFNRIKMIPEIEAVFILDADGQHDPDEIKSFVSKYRKGHFDLLIGNRMNGIEGMPLIRRFTNRLTSIIISIRLKYKIEDSQSGYRLIKSELLKKLELVTSHFETESELLIKAGQKSAVIGSVPIKTIYKYEDSKINPWRDTFRFLILVIRSFFW